MGREKERGRKIQSDVERGVYARERERERDGRWKNKIPLL